MEGVTDFVMRDLLTSLGNDSSMKGFDRCVTEFLRVTHQLHPKKVFFRHAPELHMGSRTRSGVPVTFQLLGGNPEALADNAKRAQELGASGIDLNFGCPAKTVNRHDGGASLLQYPNRIYQITQAVAQALIEGQTSKSQGLSLPLSVKMRLGFLDTQLLLENALAAQEGGAQWITLHCRTKSQGYRPPAYWEEVQRLQSKIKIPIHANGDIFDLESFDLCQRVSGAQSFMLGRGILKDPYLAQRIRSQTGLIKTQPPKKVDITLVRQFFMASEEHINIHFATARTKQWLKTLGPSDPKMSEFFLQAKVLKAFAFKDFLLEKT